MDIYSTAQCLTHKTVLKLKRNTNCDMNKNNNERNVRSTRIVMALISENTKYIVEKAMKCGDH